MVPASPLKPLNSSKISLRASTARTENGPTEDNQLGVETPLGEGNVGMDRFVNKLKEIGYDGPLTIEREISGDQQIQDLIKAKGIA